MPQNLHILLVRHGQTDANAGGVLQGHQPTPLNALGVRQATQLAAKLAARHPPVEVLVSSDLPRASQTAGAIASACRLTPRLDPAWRERGFGLLEGKQVGRMETWRAASGEIDPPGAEPLDRFQDRIRIALLALPAAHPHARVIAVVTHGGAVRSILRMLQDGRLTLAEVSTGLNLVEIVNCGILHLVMQRGQANCAWTVAAVNDCAHLETDSVTRADLI